MSTFIPAYKDTFFEASVSSLDFYIMTDNVVVFKGRAIKSPSEDKLRININKIAKDYLEHSLPDFREADKVVLPNAGAFRFFELYRTDGTLLQTYGVLFDWEGDFDGSTKILSNPIRPNVSAQMKLPFTIYSPSGETAVIVWTDEGYGLFFNNLTRSLVFPYTGGQAVIEFSTNFPYESITASATTTGYTVGQITPTSVTVTSNVNSGSSIWNAQIVFLYNGEDVGWDRTSVTTFDSGSTPVTGITWDSGITVERPCWVTVPFANGRDPEVYLTYGEGGTKEMIWSTGVGRGRVFIGGNPIVNITPKYPHNYCSFPFTLQTSNEMVIPNYTGDYMLSEDVGLWSLDTYTVAGFQKNYYNASGDTLAVTKGSVWDGVNKLGETTFKQIYDGYTGTEIVSDYTVYPYHIIDIGPIADDGSSEKSEAITSALTVYNLPDFCATKLFPDNSIYVGGIGLVKIKKRYMKEYRDGSYYCHIYSKYPADAFGGDFNAWPLRLRLPPFNLTIPNKTKALFNLTINSAMTVSFEGTKDEYRRIFKRNVSQKQDTSGRTKENPTVQCLDGVIGLNAMTLHQEKGWSGICADCAYGGFSYEYPRNEGDPSSTKIYYSGTTQSGWTVRDEDYIAMQPLSDTQSGDIGILTFPRPPYKIEGRIAQWYRSDSIKIGGHNGSLAGSGGTNPICEIGSGGTANGETLELKNLEKGYFVLSANSNLIVPNARDLTLINNGSVSNAGVFAPSVNTFSILRQTTARGITQLTIGPMLVGFYAYYPLSALTEINFNGPYSVFKEWNYDTGIINLETFPALQVVHTLDYDVTP